MKLNGEQEAFDQIAKLNWKESFFDSCAEDWPRWFLDGEVGKVTNDSADFHHQLHHRFFECNYGTIDVPWDRWFGSFHGSDEATARVREQRKRMYGNKPPVLSREVPYAENRP